MSAAAIVNVAITLILVIALRMTHAPNWATLGFAFLMLAVLTAND